ncbi:MAG: rod shape-determining protein [Lachnospiraceae bacterium]|nr:rod shape-determining protein [Lachnospiraceae bacterium]
MTDIEKSGKKVSEKKKTTAKRGTKRTSAKSAEKQAPVGSSLPAEQGKLVFGLDIGTRSIVGTVGYREGDVFYVLGQRSKEHETRAMLDGQIHDISAVAKSITEVKQGLEKDLNIALKDVCIAAAGRVLKTEETSVTLEFENEKLVTGEDVAALNAMGIEKAYEQFQNDNDTNLKFYCVGNSVIRYYMNGYQIGAVEEHKAHSIGCDMIATFLPDDVVDGLYRSVELAGLRVVNMTLEPIAAISVAIPENYRMLNIGLVDVGAGTSDICITRDGCVVAYGMIPVAGDAMTEIIAKNYLVDFNTAEEIKCGISDKDVVEYKDIMGLPQKVSKEDILNLIGPQIDEEAKLVAEKFKELNGGKPVSAVFVVGGGGTVEGYTSKLSEHLGIIAERVAVRGEEVLNRIVYKTEAEKNSRMVTPVGICLNYYEQGSNFIYVTFNDERIKLYDGGNLAVVDAAMHASFPNEGLFPKRGPAVNYTINGRSAIRRGAPGDPAIIKVGGKDADMHTPVRANDVIEVKESTEGEAGHITLAELPEFKSVIRVNVNGSRILLPEFAEVNGEIKTGFYEIEDGDEIEMRDYYTVKEVKEFMDVILDGDVQVTVNNEPADDDTKVYENFSIKWGLKKQEPVKDTGSETADKAGEESGSDSHLSDKGTVSEDAAAEEYEEASGENGIEEAGFEEYESEEDEPDDEIEDESVAGSRADKTSDVSSDNTITRSITVEVNGKSITLSGKSGYVFVDVFDYIDFDLKKVGGDKLITNLNGSPAEYMHELRSGDIIEIRWI